LFPLPVEQLKAIIANIQMLTIMFGHKKNLKTWELMAYMLMNFDLVKWRLASLKAYSAPAAGSYTRAKKRHERCY
jgi:2-oxoglutarate dehydrogenase E1 component